MMVAGIDVGTGSTKAVLYEEDGGIVARIAFPTGFVLPAAGERAVREILAAGGVRRGDVDYLAATGYGRYYVPGRDIQITDLTCNARAAVEIVPGTRCVVDIGAQSSRAAAVDERGRIQKFKVNDRCAAGAGRFLDRVAKYLELSVEELGTVSMRSKQPQSISSICAVLAESEIINQVTEGHALEDIVMGAHLSIAERVLALVRQAGGSPPVALCGGVSQNAGMVRALQDKGGFPVHISQESPFAGAFGAALLGTSRLRRKRAATGA